MDNTYYIYFYRNPLKNGEVFYIGYGNHLRLCCKRERMYDHVYEYKKGIVSSNKHKYYTLKKIYDSGLEPIIEIVTDNLTWEAAIKLEIELIELYKQTLVNIASGGDGGDTFSGQPEWKKKIIRLKLRTKTPTKHSDDLIKTFSKERTGMNNPFYGKKHTAETKDKCGATWRGRKIPAELKRKRAHFSIYHVKFPDQTTKIFNGRPELSSFFKSLNTFLRKNDKVNWQCLLKTRQCKGYVIEKLEIGRYK